MAYDDTPIDKLDKEAKLRRFREWKRLCDEVEAPQREREEEDLDFQIAENQWSEKAKAARGDRPMLSVSLLLQPMQLVQNQAANAHLGIELAPVSEDADKELAEIKQGLYQRIQRDGNAQQARLWALDRAKQCGRGFYRITTKYDEDSDDENDQEIVYERILHQSMVYVDPAAQASDFSDARFMFQAAFMPLESFRAEYPNAEYTSSKDFLGDDVEAPDWVDLSGDSCQVLVAECFYKVPTDRGMAEVHRAVLTGYEILEDAPWMGGRKYIPIVPVIGRELQPIRGVRRWEGMVRPARDAQQIFNFGLSSAVERASLEPKAPFILTREQLEGNKQYWDRANKENLPYLVVNGFVNGQALPPPQRAQIDGSGTNLALVLVQQGRDLVQSATNVFEPALGKLPQQQDAQSGRAILALQQQTDAGTSNYLDNLKLISLPLDARIVLDLMPVVYDRPGRVTQVLGSEDEPRVVMLNAPFTTDDRGLPIQAPPGSPKAKIYDLSKGRYSIVPVIGKSPQTRLEQGQEFLTKVLQSLPPQMVPLALDLMFKFRSEPGSRELSERFRRYLEQTSPNILGDDNEQSMEKIQAQAMALQQQAQQLAQQLQQAMEYIKTEQAKHQAQVEIAKLKGDVDLAVAQLRAEVELRKAQLATAKDTQATEAKVAVATMETQQDSEEGALDRAHETEMQHTELAHDVAMARTRAAIEPAEGSEE